MIDQRSALLNQLRLERDDAPSAGGSARKWRALGVGISLLAASGAAAWFVLESKAAPVVRVATAKPTVGDTAARHGPGSILDASGYVVARRQATVSSKITGRVVELSIEEGRRVEEGEIIARLEDTNQRAALAQALAQRDQARANLEAARVALETRGPSSSASGNNSSAGW